MVYPGRPTLRVLPQFINTNRVQPSPAQRAELLTFVAAFAKKSATALRDANVGLFRSEWPRDGNGTFSDDFWLVAADVGGATRSWVRFQPGGGEERPGHPLQPKPGDAVGYLRGSALLLTRSGILCGADFEAWLTRTGGVNSRCMDMIFSNIQRDEYVPNGADGWGWYNQGRWRPDRSLDMKIYGTDARVNTIRFKERYYRSKEPEPGYGTSAALSTFVNNHGETRWPKHFITFDY